MDNQKMVALIERVAKMANVSPFYVSVDFHLYTPEDGGPAWTIRVEDKAVRGKGMRLVATAHAATLDEAEAQLVVHLTPKDKHAALRKTVDSMEQKGLLTKVEANVMRSRFGIEGGE